MKQIDFNSNKKFKFEVRFDDAEDDANYSAVFATQRAAENYLASVGKSGYVWQPLSLSYIKTNSQYYH